ASLHSQHPINAQPPGGQTVTARELVLVDQAGRVQARIAGAPINLPGIEVKDSAQHSLLSVAVLGEMTVLALAAHAGPLGRPGFVARAWRIHGTAAVYHGSSRVEMMAASETATVQIAGASTSGLPVANTPKSPGGETSNFDQKVAIGLAVTSEEAM